MNEYIDNEVTSEIVKYLGFVKATGTNYEQLYEKHVAAVEALDEARDRRKPTGDIMAITPSLYAYLTDLALQHLAIGASIQMRHAVHENEDL